MTIVNTVAALKLADTSSRQMAANMHCRAHARVHFAVIRAMRDPLKLATTPGAIEAFEDTLTRLRATTHNSVYHPQTCGRVTREDAERVMRAKEGMRKMLAMNKAATKKDVNDWEEE